MALAIGKLEYETWFVLFQDDIFFMITKTHHEGNADSIGGGS